MSEGHIRAETLGSSGWNDKCRFHFCDKKSVESLMPHMLLYSVMLSRGMNYNIIYHPSLITEDNQHSQLWTVLFTHCRTEVKPLPAEV